MIKRTECPNCETVVDVEQVIVKPRAYNILGFNVLATLPNYLCPNCGKEFEDEESVTINTEHLYDIDFKQVTGMTVKEYKKLDKGEDE